mmetsp:Transcript_60571/g.180105  ORF Transcript_60571/g.180105 Transcript_60571/m.180105 type:complete len:380 (-) Transcript_60571:1131-2270(-)
MPTDLSVSGCESPRTSREPARASRQSGSASSRARGSAGASCMSMSARLETEASVCGWRLPSTSRQPARASLLRGSASRSILEFCCCRPKSLRRTARLLTERRVSGCLLPRVRRFSARDSRLRGKASSSLPRSESNCECVSMAVMVSGWRSPSVRRHESSLALESGSASSSLPSWCSSIAWLFTASMVSAWLAPSLALRASTTSRQSGSASSSSPKSCSSLAMWSTMEEPLRASGSSALSRSLARASTHLCSCSSSLEKSSSKPPSARAMAPSTAAFWCSMVVSAPLRQPEAPPASSFLSTFSMSSSRHWSSTAASLSPSSNVSLLPTAIEICSSIRHQERLSGIGSSHGAASMHVWPMALRPVLKVDWCHMSGSSAVRW